jgi:CheY-specific phosphatase CheX
VERTGTAVPVQGIAVPVQGIAVLVGLVGTAVAGNIPVQTAEDIAEVIPRTLLEEVLHTQEYRKVGILAGELGFVASQCHP